MGRLRPCPTLPAPSARPGCRPARSGFFCARVRVVDLDLATLALAHGRTRMAPGTVALPTDTGIVQHRPDGVRADVGQPIRCAPQGTLQRVQRPGRRPIAVAIWRASELGQDPFALGWAYSTGSGAPLCLGSIAASPTWLNRVTHWVIESPTARPTSRAASVYERPALAASSARARATDAAGALWLRANRSRAPRSDLVNARSGSFFVRLTPALLGQLLETAPEIYRILDRHSNSAVK
jgi:hypothetical protein